MRLQLDGWHGCSCRCALIHHVTAASHSTTMLAILLPLLQPAQLLLFFSYDCPPFTLFSCLSARCLRFHFRQTMPYLPWHFLLSSCLSCICCQFTLTCPLYSPVFGTMPVPSKTHRCLFLLFTLLTVANKSRKNASCPCCVAGYPVIFSCSFE